MKDGLIYVSSATLYECKQMTYRDKNVGEVLSLTSSVLNVSAILRALDTHLIIAATS